LPRPSVGSSIMIRAGSTAPQDRPSGRPKARRSCVFRTRARKLMPMPLQNACRKPTLIPFWSTPAAGALPGAPPLTDRAERLLFAMRATCR
jgi:hypothetical protein